MLSHRLRKNFHFSSAPPCALNVEATASPVLTAGRNDSILNCALPGREDASPSSSPYDNDFGTISLHLPPPTRETVKETQETVAQTRVAVTEASETVREAQAAVTLTETQTVAEPRKKRAPRPTALQDLLNACESVWGHRAKGLLLTYSVKDYGMLSLSITVKLPSGKTRIYSTDATFPTKRIARETVARIALDSGVLDFLKTEDPSVEIMTMNILFEECKSHGFQPPELDVKKGVDGTLTRAKLKFTISEGAYLTYTVDGAFDYYTEAQDAVVEKAANGRVLAVLRALAPPLVPESKQTSPGEEKENTKKRSEGEQKTATPPPAQSEGLPPQTTESTGAPIPVTRTSPWPLPDRPVIIQALPSSVRRTKAEPTTRITGATSSSRGVGPSMRVTGANTTPLAPRRPTTRPSRVQGGLHNCDTLDYGEPEIDPRDNPRLAAVIIASPTTMYRKNGAGNVRCRT
ncbi:hypothetical protein FRB90_006363 [Tulasnella sp. 427]|nr:hypothetical protein FRB90_006363 [Tulasnella sp. 427]